jgi:hypothetical protein
MRTVWIVSATAVGVGLQPEPVGALTEAHKIKTRYLSEPGLPGKGMYSCCLVVECRLGPGVVTDF